MEAWARAQGMDPVEVFTDEAGPVDVTEIKRAVRRIVDHGADQLVIYFAGHGVNIRYQEYWLLSDAPRDTQAAVPPIIIDVRHRCFVPARLTKDSPL